MRCPASPNCPYCDDDGDGEAEQSAFEAHMEAHLNGECPDLDELEEG